MATSLFFGSTSVVSPASVAVSELKVTSPSPASSSASPAPKLVLAKVGSPGEEQRGSRRDALKLAAALLVGGAVAAQSANAGLVEELLAKSAANKELNDRKRLATSGANTARAYTVLFGTCNFPKNFTGCQDLAKKENVPFLSDDLKLECEGKDKHKCGSNVFWKW